MGVPTVWRYRRPGEEWQDEPRIVADTAFYATQRAKVVLASERVEVQDTALSLDAVSKARRPSVQAAPPGEKFVADLARGRTMVPVAEIDLAIKRQIEDWKAQAAEKRERAATSPPQSNARRRLRAQAQQIEVCIDLLRKGRGQ